MINQESRTRITTGIALSFIILVLVLTGCGEDAFDKDGTTQGGSGPSNPGSGPSLPPTPLPPPPPPPGVSSPAHTIALTSPMTNSVQNLGGGVYRRVVSAIVTDQDGNAVADNTKVSLNILDSIIAQGEINDTDSISGSTLNDLDVQDGSGLPSSFSNAYVIRNESKRKIQTNDHVFLINADEEDKDRKIASSGVSENQLTLTDSYSRIYPNVDYPTSDSTTITRYIIGASLLGAEISGLDLNGNLITGVASTKQGIATFYVTYPANNHTIGTGCFGGFNDPRAKPDGSAKVYLVASVSEAVTAVNDNFCFVSIAGGKLFPSPESLSAGAGEPKIITVYSQDGGDKVPLAYHQVFGSIKDANGSDVVFSNGQKTVAARANANGYAVFSITVFAPPATGSMTITFSSGDPETKPVNVSVSDSGNIFIPPPLSVTAAPSSVNAGQIEITWDEIVGATGYYVYQSDTTPVTTASMRTGTLITGTTYIAQSLTTGTDYYFAVSTVFGGFESPLSAEVTATAP